MFGHAGSLEIHTPSFLTHSSLTTEGPLEGAVGAGVGVSDSAGGGKLPQLPGLAFLTSTHPANSLRGGGPAPQAPEQSQAPVSEQSQLALLGPGRTSGRCHTRTKLAGNQPSPSATRPHHHSLLVASITSMTSPALKPNSWSSMVTWSQSASAHTTLPSLMSCGKSHGQAGQRSKAAMALFGGQALGLCPPPLSSPGKRGS